MVWVGDGRSLGDWLRLGCAVGLCEGGAALVVTGATGTEERGALLPGVAVGDAEPSGEADGVAEPVEDGAPALVAAWSGPVWSGEVSPDVGAGWSPVTGDAGVPPSPAPPESAATESIAAAPTTAIVPIP